MEKLRVGVVGAGRGKSMMRFCKTAENACLVAVCDIWEEGLNRVKEEMGTDGIGYYTSYDEFLNHPMDAVILANYAPEHVPLAIKAMEKGIHVMSEVMPSANLKEAIELVETVERTGCKYAYLENTCYMPGPREMKKLYREGVLGEFEYGEGEYCHNCEDVWTKLTHGKPDHWRNNMYASFYCSHSLGPLIHITGLRPKSVVGVELPELPRMRAMGRKGGIAAVELVTLENGAVCKSVHGQLYCHSLWWSLYGSKGRMETAREDTEMGHAGRIYLNYDKVGSVYNDHENHVEINYLPKDEHSKKAKKFSHGGADYYCTWNAVEYMRGNPDADIIDVYEAFDMYLPGMFAHFSFLEGSKAVEIPDLRDPAQREKYRNDTRCTLPKQAGDQLIPHYKEGHPEIPMENYENIRKKWIEEGCP